MLSNSEEEVRKLVTQQENDSSLSEMRSKAGKQEDGYCRDNGVLVVSSQWILKRNCLELLGHPVEGKRYWTKGTEV